MHRFLDFLTERGLQCFHQERIPLDIYDDSDTESGRRYDPRSFLETDPVKGPKRLSPDITGPDSLFKYFIDGSRRTYKIGNVLVNDNYLPIVAGQAGAACCFRADSKVRKHKLITQNLLVLPNEINDLVYSDIKEDVTNTVVRNIRLRLVAQDFKKDQGRLEDQSIAKINVEMQRMELEILKELHRDRTLGPDRLLILDGSLQFSKARIQEEWFRHVIGVAKSFNSNLKELLAKKDQEIGSVLVGLEYGERTPVFRIEAGNLTIGAWYVRIRNRAYMKSPMDGIVKIEKVAMRVDNEHINGIDSDLIDNITLSVLAERLPTCYGADNRWPAHLYPIYLTESFLKNSFVSDHHFVNVF